jgi:hypothetical protein
VSIWILSTLSLFFITRNAYLQGWLCYNNFINSCWFSVTWSNYCYCDIFQKLEKTKCWSQQTASFYICLSNLFFANEIKKSIENKVVCFVKATNSLSNNLQRYCFYCVYSCSVSVSTRSTGLHKNISIFSLSSILIDYSSCKIFLEHE